MLARAGSRSLLLSFPSAATDPSGLSSRRCTRSIARDPVAGEKDTHLGLYYDRAGVFREGTQEACGEVHRGRAKADERDIAESACASEADHRRRRRGSGREWGGREGIAGSGGHQGQYT